MPILGDMQIIVVVVVIIRPSGATLAARKNDHDEQRIILPVMAIIMNKRRGILSLSAQPRRSHLR